MCYQLLCCCYGLILKKPAVQCLLCMSVVPNSLSFQFRSVKSASHKNVSSLLYYHDTGPFLQMGSFLASLQTACLSPSSQHLRSPKAPDRLSDCPVSTHSLVPFDLNLLMHVLFLSSGRFETLTAAVCIFSYSVCLRCLGSSLFLSHAEPGVGAWCQKTIGKL